jgi:hypothetical protein
MKKQNTVIEGELDETSGSKKKKKKSWFQEKAYAFYQEYGHIAIGCIFSAIAIYLLAGIALGLFFALLGGLFITGYFRDEE